MKTKLLGGLLLIGAPFSGIAQTNTFPSSGNVGIGTTVPNSTLVVNAATSGDGGTHNGSGSVVFIKQNTIWDANQPWALFVSGYSSLGGIRVNGADPQRGIFKTSGQLGVAVGDNSSITFSQNSTDERLKIDPNGNIGIGTANPQAKLHVEGDFWMQKTGSPAGLQFHAGLNNASLQFIKYGTKHAGVVFNGSQLIFKGMSTGPDHDPDQTLNNTENVESIFLGNVGIGTTTPQAKLAVNGDIFSKKVKVTQTGWPDYVFATDYKLPSLQEVEAFIKQNQHLPEVPSAKEVEEKGLDLGDNQAVLLKKIEEQMLYILELNKKNQTLEQENQQQKLINQQLEARLQKIEALIKQTLNR